MRGESAARWEPAPDPIGHPPAAHPEVDRAPAEVVDFPLIDTDARDGDGSARSDEGSPSAPDRRSRKARTPHRANRVASRRGTSPVLAGLAGGLTASLLSAAIIGIPVALIWIFVTGDSVATGLKAGVTMWLAAQAVPVTIAGVGVSILPWGFGVIVLLIVAATARWSARMSGLRARDRRQVMGLSVVAAIVYGGVASVLASFAGGVPAARAGFAAIPVLIVWWWSAAGRAGLRAEALGALPAHVRIGLRAGLIATGLMLAAGAIGLLVSVLVHRVEFTTLLTSPTSATGIAALCLLMLGYLPTAIGWSLSFLIGPGFTISGSQVVSPWVHSSADVTLPAFPWLAAIPGSGAPLLPLVLLPVGLLAGWLLTRRLRRAEITSMPTRLTAIGVAAVTSGAIVGLVLRLSSGAAGVDRLAFIGPNSIQAAVFAGVVVAAGALIIEAALAVRRRLSKE